MLDWLQAGGRPSGRRLRLFAAACVRRIWHLLTDPRARDAVEATERYAEGLLDDGQIDEAHVAAQRACWEVSLGGDGPAINAADAAFWASARRGGEFDRE